MTDRKTITLKGQRRILKNFFRLFQHRIEVLVPGGEMADDESFHLRQARNGGSLSCRGMIRLTGTVFKIAQKGRFMVKKIHTAYRRNQTFVENGIGAEGITAGRQR